MAPAAAHAAPRMGAGAEDLGPLALLARYAGITRMGDRALALATELLKVGCYCALAACRRMQAALLSQHESFHTNAGAGAASQAWMGLAPCGCVSLLQSATHCSAAVAESAWGTAGGTAGGLARLILLSNLAAT